MKRALCILAAIMVSSVAFAQDDETPRWSAEFSANAFLSIFHGSYNITAGARINDNVFGLGSGYGLEFWDAYPAQVSKIPLYAFYRLYLPLGEKRRFFVMGEATLGGECVYKISGTPSPEGGFPKTPYWTWRASISPGIALRLFGNTSIFFAPTLEFLRNAEFMPGLSAGINVGF